MRILCYINHFFGKNPAFLGKSSLHPDTDSNEVQKQAERRRKILLKNIEQLKTLGEIDVRVCGISGFSIVPVDLTFDAVKDNPLLLIYESLNEMAKHVAEYDYFINVEDDIFIPQETFANIVAFDAISRINEILLPNRLEKAPDGSMFCVDTMAIQGWTQQRMVFNGKQLRVALNPHSGLLILSRTKLAHTLQFVDSAFRKPILYNELDSAFAYFHSPFALFRSEDIEFNYVIHADNWWYSPGEAKAADIWKYRFNSIQVTDFIPPIVVRGFSFLIKKVFSGGDKKN